MLTYTFPLHFVLSPTLITLTTVFGNPADSEGDRRRTAQLEKRTVVTFRSPERIHRRAFVIPVLKMKL